jgi:hypothetical protein
MNPTDKRLIRWGHKKLSEIFSKFSCISKHNIMPANLKFNFKFADRWQDNIHPQRGPAVTNRLEPPIAAN